MKLIKLGCGLITLGVLAAIALLVVGVLASRPGREAVGPAPATVAGPTALPEVVAAGPAVRALVVSVPVAEAPKLPLVQPPAPTPVVAPVRPTDPVTVATDVRDRALSDLQKATDAGLLQVHGAKDYRALFAEWQAKEAERRRLQTLDAGAKVKDVLSRIHRLEKQGLDRDLSVSQARVRLGQTEQALADTKAAAAARAEQAAADERVEQDRRAAAAADSAARDEGPTADKYGQIQTGMSYAQVKGIMGYAGIEQSTASFAGTTSTYVAWSSRFGLANLTVNFTNGVVTAKAKVGF